MSPGSRRADGRDKDGKSSKGRLRRRKNEVSLADRLNPSTDTGNLPSATVLPGTSAPKARKDRHEAPDRPKAEDRPHEQARPPGTVLPGTAKAAPVGPQTRRQLREQREAQKRKAQQRWLLTGFAVIAVVVLVVLAVVWLAGRDDEGAPAAGAQRVERTVTMTLAGEGQPATSGALMVSDTGSDSAGSVLIPSRFFVEGATPGPLPFGETVQLGEVGAPGTALADTLEVVVDDTWQVSNGMLAELVDAADGVLVNVDVDIVQGNNIVVATGEGQLLNGQEAVAYATFLGPNEVEQARLARFSQVLDQVMKRLPSDRDALLEVFTNVNAAQNATMSVESLTDFALDYGDVARTGDTAYQSLPVKSLDVGGGRPSFGIDIEGLDRLRQGLLADSLPSDSGGDQIAVLVQNGVGTPDLEQDAATLLRDEGYEFLNGGNANEFGYDETVVLIPDTTPASIALGESVATTLGVPESSVQVTDEGSSLADVIVILGEDFKP